MGEVAVLLRRSVRKLPFVSKPCEAILDWHLSRGVKGKLKDIDEDLDENIVVPRSVRESAERPCFGADAGCELRW